MYTPAGQRGTFLLVAILLVISILLEQYWIAPFFPWLSQLGGVRLMFVFLDIPVQLPVIDWLQAGLLFLFFYGVVIMPGLRRREAAAGPGMLSQVSAGQMLRTKLWGLFIRWWVMLGLLLAGGGLFYVLKDYMPRAVRNGIDSFGVRADVLLPYPSEDTLHLEGGMIMLAGCIIGWRMLVKKAVLEPIPVRETVGSGRRRLAAGEAGRGRVIAKIPEPVEVKVKKPMALAGVGVADAGTVKKEKILAAAEPRICAPVRMPETAIRKGGIRPCIVDGEIKPAVFRGERQPARLAGQFAPSTSSTSTTS